jgi:20S proteasome subunit beta 4
MSAGRSIVQMKSDENKIKALGPHLAMAFGGEPGDTNKFADWVERNLRLFHIRSVPPRVLVYSKAHSSEITLPSYHPQHLHGFVAPLLNHFDHEVHMPSTSFLQVTISPPTSPTFIGSITWVRKLSYLMQHMVWEST